MYRAYRIVVTCILLSGIFSCSKELSYENNVIPAGVSATGTLEDSSGNCMTITPKGTYYNGVAILGDTNYVQVTVNVATTGSYNIQSDRQNGFQFAGTGVFNNTGIQTINLKASGTPVAKGVTNFMVSFDSSACNFNINVQDSTGHGGSNNNGGGTDTSGIALGQWQFVANGHTYSGNIQSALFTNLIGGNLTVVGFTASGTDTAFGITVQFPGNTLDTGTYATTDAGTNFSLQIASGPNVGNIIYAANATSSQVVNITINSYNAGTKVVSGIFSGVSYDYNGTSVTITNGKFKATVQ
jgi:hypothetical protein